MMLSGGLSGSDGRELYDIAGLLFCIGGELYAAIW